MTTGYTKIVFGTQTLNLTSLSRNKTAGSVKQKVGGNLVKHFLPGREIRDWEITGRGVIVESAATTASAFRKTLEAYDDLENRGYSDGLITGSFIIESLKFDDSGNNPLHFEYTISLIEYQQ